MILTPAMLDEHDRCERRYALSRKYEPRSITPLGLLYAALEAALVSEDPEQEAKDTTLRIAQERDLDTAENRFMVVRHTGYLAGILAVALQCRLGNLEKQEPVPFGEHEWHSNLFSGHRIVLMGHWNDDALRSYAHSWGTIGELAALERSLTLTAVILGSHSHGRRHSAWTKGHLHPSNRELRFRKRSGGSLDWQEVWRDQSQIATVDWLKVMQSDGVLDELILNREIRYDPADSRMVQARSDMKDMARSMPHTQETSPMRRSACDEVGRGACPYQACCYSPTPVTPDQLPHLYRIRS
ncbi:MAG TPA: hypothetical protein VGK96_28550 [Candidatus Sulfotelmatobacter sp.]|jgi:hypothetical protein